MIRTVLGDIEAAELGPTNYHEHLFQISPLLPGDELDDEERSGREAETLRDMIGLGNIAGSVTISGNASG